MILQQLFASYAIQVSMYIKQTTVHLLWSIGEVIRGKIDQSHI